ncbi:uncharacterized protein MONOS_17136 [Monocercomonoides exilis]|uniref:uncharacterized protein n=1 Tax=Monocercomonoides exilis TaxID=2049356 RepID=UPI00355961EB|nr:hypothetical protein MONOS_17136 [Monocercomonoides exilis]
MQFNRTNIIQNIDTFACGLDESHACSTISRCLTQLIPGFVTDIEIFSGTIIETKNVDCGINTYAIYCQSDLSITIRTEFEASVLSLFSVSTGTLNARDFVLVHDSARPNNCGSRLFEITGAGEMSVNRLIISTGSGQSSETAFTTELINVQNGIFKMESLNRVKAYSTASLILFSLTYEISSTISDCASE